MVLFKKTLCNSVQKAYIIHASWYQTRWWWSKLHDQNFKFPLLISVLFMLHTCQKQNEYGLVFVSKMAVVSVADFSVWLSGMRDCCIYHIPYTDRCGVDNYWSNEQSLSVASRVVQITDVVGTTYKWVSWSPHLEHWHDPSTALPTPSTWMLPLQACLLSSTYPSKSRAVIEPIVQQRLSLMTYGQGTF